MDEQRVTEQQSMESLTPGIPICYGEETDRW